MLNPSGNQFTGSVPQEVGNLGDLTGPYLSDNALAGALPASLVGLNGLQSFHFGGTWLCEPPDSSFQEWLSRIGDLVRSDSVCQTVYVPLTDA